jgi:hypothetical protein
MKIQLFILLASVRTSFPKLLALIWTFFLPISGLFLLVGFCIALDTISGIWKSYKLKIKITSRKLSSIISKMMLYQITLILFYLIDNFILNQIMLKFFSVPLMLTKIVALILISIELMSLNENIIAVKNFSLWDGMKSLFARAKEIKTNLNELRD